MDPGIVIMGMGALAVMGVCGWAWHSHQQEALRRQQRWNWLVQRFGVECATGIVQRRIWQGQTSEMLVEAWGRPVSVDEHMTKTRVRHTWKYVPMGYNRYAKRVHLEDGIVVGWDV